MDILSVLKYKKGKFTVKQFFKKILLRFQTGQKVWNHIVCHYHKVRRIIKHAIQKKNDFNKYVYPVIGKHPGKKEVFLVLSPTYKNLGDHAIAKAEIDLLTEWGIKYREVTIDVVQVLAKHNDYKVFGCGTVLITGGGYLGTLWPHMHEMTSKIIEQNPHAKIVILPNTLYFEETPDGQKLFENSIEVFNLPNVKRIYLREKISYDMVWGKYSKAKLMPDMVMSLNESRSGMKRKGCLISLRDDKEKTLSESKTTAVYDSAKQLFGTDVITMDMRNDTDVLVDERMEKLGQKFDQFRHAELVITDRLHGMVFAAITGTECIVMNSRSHKLIGCYEWLEQLDYIHFCNNAEEICSIYDEMSHEEHYYDVNMLSPWFGEMKNELILIIQGKQDRK